MRVRDKLVISEERLIGINSELFEKVGLLGSIVYFEIEQKAKDCKHYTNVSVPKLSLMINPNGANNSNHIMKALRYLEELGYIKYSPSSKYRTSRVRLVKRAEYSHDIDIRWTSAFKAFSPSKIMILSTLDALGSNVTTSEICDNLPELNRGNVSALLSIMKDDGLISKEIEEQRGAKKRYNWSINFDNITKMEGLEMTSNLSRLLELKEAYIKKAEEAMDAVKFYEEQITEAIKLQNKKTKEME